MRIALLVCLFSFFGCRENLDYQETHLHASSFEGDVRSTPEHNHIELYVGRDGTVEVYLFDKAVNPIEAKGATGTIEIWLQNGESQKIPLTYGSPDDHDMLSAKLPKDFPNPLQAVVRAEHKGVNYRAKFIYNLNDHPNKKPHIHDSYQGGQVAMSGETHVEMVWVKPGEYRVYLSDMMRGPLPPSFAKEASLVIEPDAEQPETLPLRPDPTGKFLQAFGAPLEKDPLSVRVWLTLGTAPKTLIDYSLPMKK